METKEIFAQLKAHMLEGMVFHDEMSRYYDFLCMPECKERHERHYFEESKSYKKLCSYYMRNFGRLIPQEPMARPDIIPQSWYNYERQDVDVNTKRNAHRTACEKWVEWETETKDMYENMYAELMDNGEIASALFIEHLIHDVAEELADAKERHLALRGI